MAGFFCSLQPSLFNDGLNLSAGDIRARTGRVKEGYNNPFERRRILHEKTRHTARDTWSIGVVRLGGGHAASIPVRITTN